MQTHFFKCFTQIWFTAFCLDNKNRNDQSVPTGMQLACWKTMQDSRAAISAGFNPDKAFWKSNSVTSTS
jgi:hypothetical protein